MNHLPESPVALNKIITSFVEEIGESYLYKLLDSYNFAKINNNKNNSYNNFMV